MSWSALLTVAVGLGAAGTLFVVNDPAEILHLLAGAGWGVLAVLAFRLPQLLFSALAWAPLLDGPRPRWPFLLLLRWIRDAVNALLPVAQLGGDVVRARLLPGSGAGVVVDLATEMVAQAAFALLGLALLPSSHPLFPWLALAVAACAVMGLGFMAAQRFGLFRLAERLLPQSGAGLDAGLRRRYRDPPALLASIALHLASWLAGTLEAWAALHVLGVQAGLAEALAIESLSQVARSLGFLIPGAIGVQEGGLVLVCGLFGIPPQQALAFALLRRIRDLAFGLPGLVAWRWLATGAAWLPRPAELSKR